MVNNKINNIFKYINDSNNIISTNKIRNIFMHIIPYINNYNNKIV